jgi:hypothetical protein
MIVQTTKWLHYHRSQARIQTCKARKYVPHRVLASCRVASGIPSSEEIVQETWLARTKEGTWRVRIRAFKLSRDAVQWDNECWADGGFCGSQQVLCAN